MNDGRASTRKWECKATPLNQEESLAGEFRNSLVLSGKIKVWGDVKRLRIDDCHNNTNGNNGHFWGTYYVFYSCIKYLVYLV